MRVAKIPSDRIVIFGQSLGTGVTSAVAEHFAKRSVDFAGIVLVAGFTSIPGLVAQYSLAGYLPLLSPFKGSRWFARMLGTYVVDQWPSATRIANFVRIGKRVRLFIIASKNDGDIPWTESEALFVAAANATTNGVMDIALFEKMKARATVDMGDGAFTSTWNAGGDKIIHEDIVLYGRKYAIAQLAHFVTEYRSFEDSDLCHCCTCGFESFWY
jgi:abhydrolase domain-containing protein 12